MRRQITIIWQSLSIISKVLILIPSAVMIPFLFLLILLAFVFAIPGLILFIRWFTILVTIDFNTGDMKVPTFYSSEHWHGRKAVAYIFFMSIVGVVFGGIHCAGWSFHFPSSDEAMLWRVSSAVLTGIAFLFPLLVYIIMENMNSRRWENFVIAFLSIILLAYVVSRLLLLVEAFISLRFLTPGMLALVKWTSFIPHI